MALYGIEAKYLSPVAPALRMLDLIFKYINAKLLNVANLTAPKLNGLQPNQHFKHGYIARFNTVPL